MTSFLTLYATPWARRLVRPGRPKRSFRLFGLGLLPHEIAALNAR